MNKNLFSTTTPGKIVPPADTTNAAGGLAYARSPEEALAQIAATGCFGQTFYASGEDQLQALLAAAKACSPEWVAKCAVYAREHGQMKDAPAVLLAHLASRGELSQLRRVFPRVIDNGKMLRVFVQAVRSGVTGRKSFGTAVKRLLQQWFQDKSLESLFHASIGDAPSLGDILRMVHPKPSSEAQRCMFAYLLGKPVAAMGLLPVTVQEFEAFKIGIGPVPNVNFQFLSSLPLTKEQWVAVFEKCSWTTLRMNLNTFERHGVFDDRENVAKALKRLTDPVEIAKARPMPYQLFAAAKFATLAGASTALERACDVSLACVPELPANTVVGLDISGSMHNPMTGGRGSGTSKVQMNEVAALFAAAVLKRQPALVLFPFSDRGYTVHGIPSGVLSAAQALAALPSGGTDCSLPLLHALTRARCDAVVIVSDSESWLDSTSLSPRYSGTAVMHAWRQVQAKHPKCKLVCIDLAPNTTKQVIQEPNVLFVGGFNDSVFEVVAAFLQNDETWEDKISAVDI